MSTETALYDEIRKLRALYPDPLSAVLPALRLTQERYGWLPEQALREVADALELTPAYCQSVASFYDQFHLEPVGRHVIEVCTNISCGLGGARSVLEALEEGLEVRAGETRDDDAFTLRTVECLGSCGWPTALLVDGRQRLHVKAADVPGILEELGGV